MRIIKASVEKIEDFRKEDMIDALELMGLNFVDMNFYRRVELDGDLVIYGELYDDAINVTVYENNQEVAFEQFISPVRFIDFIEDVLDQHDIKTAEIVDPDDMIISDNGIILSATDIYAKKKHKNKKPDTRPKPKKAVPTPDAHKQKSAKQTKTTTKDFVKKLARVKSSNVWSYAFQPKDNRIGDMLMQFKNKYGGPGDIYIYYDVPNKVWQRLVAAPSKGHAFWELIRNVYTYAKLTGDKRTHLPNGI